MLGPLDWIGGRTLTIAAGGRALAIVAALSVVACDIPTPKIYGADPITARVVDAATGKPIEGANVLAMWEMQYGLENHGTNFAQVTEAVTDANGDFSIPAWGPKLVVKPGAITNLAPRFLVFKTGYLLAGGANSGMLELAPSHMKSEWSGKTFLLKPFAGSSQEYADYLFQFVQRTIESVLDDGCNYGAFPRFLTAIDVQARKLQEQVPNSRLLTLAQVRETYRGICGLASSQIEGVSK